LTEGDRIEAERIKSLIRACTTRGELQSVVDAERAALLALEAREGCQGLAHQVRNLVNYQVRMVIPRIRNKAAD
jgi:hypothetical protein